MSTLAFMPWCPISKEHHMGEIEIAPLEIGAPFPSLSEADRANVDKLLEMYRGIDGTPVSKVALVSCTGGSPIGDLTDDELETAHEITTLMCFSGLASREYFDPIGRYCNSDCFALYVQRFQEPSHVALLTRRREGRSWSTWSTDGVRITVPVHCHTIREVVVDEVLLAALLAHRAELREAEWGRWENAISSFNQANTDDGAFRYQVEWVLFSGAFEHFLHAHSDAKDAAARFAEVMVPQEPLLVSAAGRRSENWTDEGKPLRYEWMREFYGIRGDFAHGKHETRRPVVWEPLEHLVLAAVAFPLVVKSLLSAAGKYSLTEEDRGQIDCFERFADTPGFVEPPVDQASSLDSHWKRLVDNAKLTRAVREAVEKAEAEGLMDPDANGSPGKEPRPAT